MPFTGFEESQITWIVKDETLYIDGGAASARELRRFESALKKLGFELISNSSYLYQRSVDTADGTRYVRVYFGLDENRQFHLEAYDPYYYEFPSSFGASLTYYSFSSEAFIPGFAADFYDVNSQDSEIYCYTNSSTANEDYTAALTAAGWDVSGGLDEASGYYTAISPDGRYMIYYAYNAKYGDLDKMTL